MMLSRGSHMRVRTLRTRGNKAARPGYVLRSSAAVIIGCSGLARDDGTETLQGELSRSEMGTLARLLRRLNAEQRPGGIIRQGSQSFIAEIARGQKTTRFSWVDPDHERPFPDSAGDVIDWLQGFTALGSSPLTLNELGEKPICPAGGKPFQPLASLPGIPVGDATIGQDTHNQKLLRR
jgi:hypothetical protein